MKAENEDNGLVQAVKSLRNRANMLASCHSLLSDHYERMHAVLLSILLVFSTLLVGLTFISDQFVQVTTGAGPDTLIWIRGLTSIAIFAVGLLLSQWRLASKGAEHREAVRHYFTIVNRARFLLESNEAITGTLVDELRSQYEDTKAIPKIPEARFLRLKQRHLRKVAISRQLDKSPHMSLRELRKMLEGEEKRDLMAGRDSAGSEYH